MIIKDQRKRFSFKILFIEIYLDYFQIPYVYVWLKDYDTDMNKCYKKKDYFGDSKNPTFSYHNRYNSFILNFKPF